MEREIPMDEWVKTVPESIRDDPLWSSGYYRLASYLYELAWLDCDLLKKDYRGREIVGQLIRSAGSIAANVEEAYGRGVGTADYVRIMRIALGESREIQGWYLRSRQVLPAEILNRRIELIQQIISLLVSTIASHRRKLS